MLWIDQFVLDRNNFPSNNICMARSMQNLSSIHRRRKKFGHAQGLPWCNRGTWEPWNLLKHRVFQGARAPKSANSLRWRESPPEVTRRDGFPLSSKSNIMAQRANLKGRLPWTMCAEFLEKLKILWIDQFVLDRNNFPSNNKYIVRFMQNLSSIHRRRKHIEPAQGLPWCNRGAWKSWNLLKKRVFQGARAPKSANSLRWRESPPRSDS